MLLLRKLNLQLYYFKSNSIFGVGAKMLALHTIFLQHFNHLLYQYSSPINLQLKDQHSRYLTPVMNVAADLYLPV